MRVCLDARMMGAGNTRGIGRFIEELVRAMLEQNELLQLVLITRQDTHPFKKHPRVETVVADILWYGLAEQIRMPFVFRRIRADVFFVPHWNVPRYGMSKPFLVFIHDLILFHAPESARASLRSPVVSWVKKWAHRRVVSHAIRQARAVLVPTQSVKNDVVTFYPDAKIKIQVAGEGMPALSFFDGSPRSEGCQFILSVGSAYPHKGLDDVLAAWPKIERERPGLEWWIAGEKDVFMSRLEARVRESGITSIRFLGPVSDERLHGLYGEAMGLIYPSHLEGFGLPPLEAIAAGCPVLCSDIPVLKEVLGEEGAIFFRVGSADGILGAVRKLWTDPQAARQQTQKNAVLLAARHSWTATAQRVLQILSSA